MGLCQSHQDKHGLQAINSQEPKASNLTTAVSGLTGRNATENGEREAALSQSNLLSGPEQPQEGDGAETGGMQTEALEAAKAFHTPDLTPTVTTLPVSALTPAVSFARCDSVCAEGAPTTSLNSTPTVRNDAEDDIDEWTYDEDFTNGKEDSTGADLP